MVHVAPYAVARTDAAGTVDFRARGWIAVRVAEKALVDAATANYPDTSWTAACAQGNRVVVGGPGTTFDCSPAVADEPQRNEEHTIRITDDAGGFAIERCPGTGAVGVGRRGSGGGRSVVA